MNKNLIIPLSIIVVGALIGGVLVFSGGGNDNPLGANVAQANLRKVDLEIKNMFCVGCRASVVSSITGLPGVIQADADPRTNSGWVVYDPDITTKEQIVASSTFWAYPARILADQPYGGTATQERQQKMPLEIELKLSVLAQGLAEYEVSFEPFLKEELDNAINQGNWGKVENILDNYLQALKERYEQN
ncbi:cation transporter [Patescibacteria group bacterium AH-259-L07]|nr:cation transporter [Patescibacteria group bacterium AH-259-L07]